ncbi:MAG: hypothetical protein CME26_03295 [Gemmatimonadetes bacterium]|nr:hypothetical protein [Gemmatimonadota bacterium]
MRISLLDILCCPDCGTPELELEIFSGEEGNVEDGLISCGSCESAFPVILGVPRMLPQDLRSALPETYPDWCRKFGEPVLPSVSSPSDGSRRLERATMESFGYQWNVFDDLYPEWRDDFLQFSPPDLDPLFFNGKFGLDAGCGMGRHTRVCASFGADVVGVDISGAVDAARRNTRELGNVDIVQGEITRHPFREEAFDFAYSFGVLHHLTDPAEGFRALARIPRKSGTLFIWVYSDTRNPIYAKLRLLTLHVPFWMLRAFCLVFAVSIWVTFVIPNKIVKRFQLRALEPYVKFDFYARHPFRVMHADFFDEMSAPVIHEHTDAEVRAWFADAGYEQVETSSTGGLGWRGLGERACAESAEN